MLFKIDENLPVEVAELLRQAGHDATTALEQFLGGKPDPSVAEVCRNERRALITLDLDFADIRRYPPGDHAGIIVFRLQKQDKPLVLDVVGRLLPMLGTEPLEGCLWIVDEQAIRIREGL